MITNLTGTCPYATMCGWCSKWDKKCDKKIGAATQTQIDTNQFDENNLTVTKVDNSMRFCRDCPNGTGEYASISSHPIRCNITGKCHTINDTCDIENTTITVKC